MNDLRSLSSLKSSLIWSKSIVSAIDCAVEDTSDSSMKNNGDPSFTVSPSFIVICLIMPLISDEIVCSIFIASITKRGCPATISSF